MIACWVSIPVVIGGSGYVVHDFYVFFLVSCGSVFSFLIVCVLHGVRLYLCMEMIASENRITEHKGKSGKSGIGCRGWRGGEELSQLFIRVSIMHKHSTRIRKKLNSVEKSAGKS